MFINKLQCQINAFEREQIWKNCWTPDENYHFTYQIKGTKRRKFQLKWIKQFPWLSYSAIYEGAFCKACVIFGPASETGVGKGCNQNVRQLVTAPCKNWKDALEIFSNHCSTSYHKFAMERVSKFLSICDGKMENVEVVLNQKYRETIQKNRAILKIIVQTILLCGKQELALRGHNDSGPLTLEEPRENDGNFKALLRYRATSGDTILINHIQNAGKNALYTSPDIQNQIINIIGKNIQNVIIERVIKSRYFCVLADETTDIQRIEQFSMCIRYVDLDILELREDFLNFIPVNDLTGNGLAKTIIENLTSFGLDLNNLRGQGYDGAANMAGIFSGVQAIVRNKYPKALFSHCMAHCLNLCLNDASKIEPIRNCIDLIKEVSVYFRSSKKRSDILKRELSESPIHSSGLMNLCETRWVERHDAVVLFVESFLCIVEALETLEAEPGPDASKARSLHRAMCNFQFIITMKLCEKMMGLTHNLSKYLQSQDIDLCIAMQQIKLVESKIADIRSNSDEEFSLLFKKAVDIAKDVGVEPSVSRIVGTQKYRSNHPAMSPEEFYRRSIFIPYTDELLASLSDRFSSKKDIIVGLQCVLPFFAVKSKFEEIEPAIKFYSEDLDTNNFVILRSEWDIWTVKWQQEPNLPRNAIAALKKTDSCLFPNMFILLQMLAVLPVSTASVERSFSTLKRLKTYLRNSTTNNRLTGLALMSVHRDIVVNEEVIIDEFSKQSRRIAFL